MKIFFCLSFFSLVALAYVAQGAEKVEEEPLQEPQVTDKSEASSSNHASQPVDESESPTKVADETGGSEEDKKYALGSLCNYCSYCKVGIKQVLVVVLAFSAHGNFKRGNHINFILSKRHARDQLSAFELINSFLPALCCSTLRR